MIMKKPLVIITGPTAVGKSELAIHIAKRINGEIISADSIQVYKYMDIGSAKLKKEEMQDIPHYLIDELFPDEEFNVVKFKEYARGYMQEIYNKNKIPIIVGGTGFYIQALLYDIDFTDMVSDTSYRQELMDLYERKGAVYLHGLLKEVDEESACQIHYNNIKRVIRALEYHKLTGGKISEHNSQQRKNLSPYNFAYFVLNRNREILYNNINLRIDKMLESGLIDEVKKLKKMNYTKDLISMQGLGYKEILMYLDGELSLEDVIFILKRDTRHFAKRQLTWFKREKEVTWVNYENFDNNQDKILEYILRQLKDKEIIK